MEAQDDGQVMLDAAGNGTIEFNSGSTRIKKVISKLVLTCTAGTTSGVVQLYFNSDFLDSGPLAASVTVYGDDSELVPGRVLRIVITGGPVNTSVFAILYHQRVSV